jgi:hypothetical protein
MAPIGLKDLFVIFLKAGLAFGGGLGILAVLEGELVTKRKALTREEFLTAYALGRLVPSGTMTASGRRLRSASLGVPGSVVALGGHDPPRVHAQRDLQRHLCRTHRHRISRRRATDHPARRAGVHRRRRATPRS